MGGRQGVVVIMMRADKREKIRGQDQGSGGGGGRDKNEGADKGG